MAKNIIMQVLTSAGYEPMYPFTPRQILNGSFLSTSTSSRYNISITGIPVPLTNSFGNDMGIIAFIPTINRMMMAMNISQCLMISHSSESELSNVDIVSLNSNYEGPGHVIFEY